MGLLADNPYKSIGYQTRDKRYCLIVMSNHDTYHVSKSDAESVALSVLNAHEGGMRVEEVKTGQSVVVNFSLVSSVVSSGGQDVGGKE